MEKTIQLDQRETQAAQAIDQEMTQAWAQIGMFSEQLAEARKLRDQATEKQRSLIRQALSVRGIDRFDSARPGGQLGTLTVTIPDEITTGTSTQFNGLSQPDLTQQ